MNAIAMTFRQSSGPIDTPWGAEMRRIEKRVRDSDKGSLLARWESGHHILQRREGSQLPRGLLKHLCESLGIAQNELSRRVRFAEVCPTKEELSQTLAKFPTWNQIVTKALTPKRAQVKKLPRVNSKHVRVLTQTLRGVEPSAVSGDHRAALRSLRDAIDRVLAG